MLSILLLSFSLHAVGSSRDSFSNVSKTSMSMADIFGLLKGAAVSAFSIAESVSKVLAANIESSTIYKGNKEYVERVELETYVRSLQRMSPNGIYTVMYGPKGVGKSELVDHVYAGQRSVVKLLVTSAHSVNDVLAQLVRELLYGSVYSGITFDDFVEAIQKCNTIPTIIFDVELGGSSDPLEGVHAVRILSKLLAPYSKCIIILSEENDALEFGRDKSREEIVHVDELTKAEAADFLVRLNTTFTADEREYVFDNIGTDPMMLVRLAGKVPHRMTLKAFVDRYLASAELDLLAFPHQQILKALKENPDGVSPEYFNKLENKGVDLSNPLAVGAAMKDSNALVYRIERGMYTLMSTAHRTAMKSYIPILPKVF